VDRRPVRQVQSCHLQIGSGVAGLDRIGELQRVGPGSADIGRDFIVIELQGRRSRDGLRRAGVQRDGDDMADADFR
jgi:hypothetical protein